MPPRRVSQPPDRTPLRLYMRVQQVTDRELAAILRQAAIRAERIVVQLGARGNIGAQVRRAQLQLVAAHLRTESARLWGEVSVTTRQGIERSALQAVEALELMDRVLWEAVGGAPDVLRQALRAQARVGVESLVSRRAFHHTLSGRIYDQRRITMAQVHRLLDQALARGASWREIAQEVAGAINPRVPGGVSYAAKRLARTELNNAFHTTTVRLANPQPWVQGYLWNLSGSHPRPDACNDYAERDHSGMGPGVWAKQAVPGKPHPQCLCYVTTATVEVDEFVDNFLGGKYDRYIQQVQDRNRRIA